VTVNLTGTNALLDAQRSRVAEAEHRSAKAPVGTHRHNHAIISYALASERSEASQPNGASRRSGSREGCRGGRGAKPLGV